MGLGIILVPFAASCEEDLSSSSAQVSLRLRRQWEASGSFPGPMYCLISVLSRGTVASETAEVVAAVVDPLLEP